MSDGAGTEKRISANTCHPSRLIVTRDFGNAEMESTKSTLSGRLTSLTIYNGRWGRGFLRQRTDEYVTVVGEALVGLREGSDYRFTGALAKHPKFGVQYEVASAMEQVEALRCRKEIAHDHQWIMQFLQSYAGGSLRRFLDLPMLMDTRPEWIQADDLSTDMPSDDDND